jgi:hypothetical protein
MTARAYVKLFQSAVLLRSRFVSITLVSTLCVGTLRSALRGTFQVIAGKTSATYYFFLPYHISVNLLTLC